MTPREALKYKDIVRLRTDNWDVKEGWILIDQNEVCLHTQRNGQPSTGAVTFSRSQFNRLIDWYHRPQKLRRKSK